MLLSMVSATLTGCAGNNENQDVVDEDMKDAFEQADLLSANIGIFSKNVSGDSISYGECGSGGAAIGEDMKLVGITPGASLSPDGKTFRFGTLIPFSEIRLCLNERNRQQNQGE